ncbi:hypothetical protein IWW48_004720 [Coemansia sp. RSA 1200]|nr:hypothetical protein IWW48_004720 [Coemansia sp. RSA 1200]
MSTTLQLTKKQRKALQFRGKLEKPATDERPKSLETNETPKLENGKNNDSSDKTNKNPEKRRNKASTPEMDVVNNAETPEKVKFEKQTSAAGHVVRFIVFVGNLPFSATAEELKTFMKSANPTSVRLMTNKDTGKSRGFAFAEFSTSADLKQALRFHHMRLGTKKINVELTAGGGGNSDNRKQKLKRRRDELEEERKKTSATKITKWSSSKSENNNDTHQYEKQDETAQNTNASGEDDYDYGQIRDSTRSSDTAAKKPNRRKRGRGPRK